MRGGSAHDGDSITMPTPSAATRLAEVATGVRVLPVLGDCSPLTRRTSYRAVISSGPAASISAKPHVVAAERARKGRTCGTREKPRSSPSEGSLSMPNAWHASIPSRLAGRARAKQFGHIRHVLTVKRTSRDVGAQQLSRGAASGI